MKEIKIFDYTGEFAENKDTARYIRISLIVPSLERKDKIILGADGKVLLEYSSPEDALLTDHSRFI